MSFISRDFVFRKADFSKCYNLEDKDLKNCLKYYEDKLESLEIFNINFCYNLFSHRRKVELGSLIPIDRLKCLTEFHALTIKFELKDLINLVNTHTFKSLSLTVPSHQSLDNLRDDYFKGFNNIEDICVEFNLVSYRLFQKLGNSFVNVKKLEIYFNDNRSHIFGFSFKQFPTNKFEKLEYLIMGSDSIYSGLNDALKDNFEIISRLKGFHINFTHETFLKTFNPNLVNIIDNLHTKIGSVQLKLTLAYLDKNYTDYNTGLYPGDETFKQFMDYYFLNRSRINLSKINLDCNINYPSYLTQIPFDLAKNGTLLQHLDFSNIHIHSTDSICKILSEMNRNLISFF